MTTQPTTVFLFDVDNTLLDNDRVQAELSEHLQKAYGQATRDRYWAIFEEQPQAYRDSVLPPDITARLAVEQASAFGWERYVGWSGRVMGMKTFGASAPLKELQRKFGFQPERVAETARELLGRRKAK